MFSSPPGSFRLPSYAEQVAVVLAEAPSPVPLRRNSSFDPRVFQLLDIEAGEEGDSKDSSSREGSSSPGPSS